MRRATPFATLGIRFGIRFGILLGIQLGILVAPADAAAAGLDDDVFEDRKLHVGFTVPEGWQLSRQTGYPSLLAFVSRGDGRISLSYTRLARREKVIQVVANNNRALDALGLKVGAAKRAQRFGHKLWRSVATTKDGKRRNHQFYVSAGQVVYILTLSCKAANERRGLADLDYILESLKMKRWALPQEALVRERGRSRGRPRKGTKPPLGAPLGKELGGKEPGGKELGGKEPGGKELGGKEPGGEELGGKELGGKELGGKELRSQPSPRHPREVRDRAQRRPASAPASRPRGKGGKALPLPPGGAPSSRPDQPSDISSRGQRKK